MKIKVEKWIVDDNISYKIVSLEKCCDKLINSKNTELNSCSDDYNIDFDENNDNNYSVKLVKSERGYDNYPEYYYETIKFCPFCGSKIIIEIVSEINKTEEYKELQKQRDELWKKCCKTDSKKKEEILKQQVRELDNKINNMLTSDDFIKEN